MQFDDLARPGALVQTVDILGDDPCAALCEYPVAAVWRNGPPVRRQFPVQRLKLSDVSVRSARPKEFLERTARPLRLDRGQPTGHTETGARYGNQTPGRGTDLLTASRMQRGL